MTKTIKPRLRGRLRLLRRDGDCGGNVGVELALTAPAVMLLLFGIVESGRALWLKNALDFSVAEAARCASINPTQCGTPDQIAAYASTRAGSGFDSSVFTATTANCGNLVSGSYPLTLAIPFVPVSLTLSAQACFPS